jgi:hypothetical protein
LTPRPIPASATKRRRHWSTLLLSTLLLLLVSGGVLVGQFYRTRLQDSMDRLRSAVVQAQTQQQRMIERARETESTLAERGGQLRTHIREQTIRHEAAEAAATASRLTAVAADLEASAERLAPSVRGPDAARGQEPRLLQAIRALTLEAGRLPVAARPPGVAGSRGGPPPPRTAPQMPIGLINHDIRSLLNQAEHALLLGDQVLATLHLEASVRLLERHHQAAAARTLARRIGQLRPRLHGSTDTEAMAGALRAAATELRALAEEQRRRSVD